MSERKILPFKKLIKLHYKFYLLVHKTYLQKAEILPD